MCIYMPSFFKCGYFLNSPCILAKPKQLNLLEISSVFPQKITSGFRFKFKYKYEYSFCNTDTTEGTAASF